MEDLIRRSDAIEALRVAYFDKDIQSAKDDPCIVDAMTDWAIRQIKSLSSADGPQEWIPCEERMPMYNVDVLVYRPTMGQKIIVDTYCGFYGEDIDDLDEWYEGWGISREHAVTAWMPLPKPWKGADDE